MTKFVISRTLTQNNILQINIKKYLNYLCDFRVAMQDVICKLFRACTYMSIITCRSRVRSSSDIVISEWRQLPPSTNKFECAYDYYFFKIITIHNTPCSANPLMNNMWPWRECDPVDKVPVSKLGHNGFESACCLTRCFFDPIYYCIKSVDSCQGKDAPPHCRESCVVINMWCVKISFWITPWNWAEEISSGGSGLSSAQVLFSGHPGPNVIHSTWGLYFFNKMWPRMLRSRSYCFLTSWMVLVNFNWIKMAHWPGD